MLDEREQVIINDNERPNSTKQLIQGSSLWSIRQT
jgi:hypothetical protein